MKIVINDIIDLINSLRTKIEKYGDDFRKSEALTRYALIDPFLRALGWDTEDPGMVKPEYTTGVGRSDYALLVNGKPDIILGAKALGREEDLAQHINYCLRVNAHYFITTDGDKWAVYEVYKDADINGKKIISWSIMNDIPSEIVLKSLTLASFNVFKELSKKVEIISMGTSIIKSGAEKIVDNPIEPIQDDKNKEIQRNKNRSEKYSIMYIGSRKYEIRKSNEILLNTAEWLIEQGKLKKEDCPIKLRGKRYLINVEPKHNFRDFLTPKRLSNGLWVETNHSTTGLIELSKELLKHYGYNENLLKLE